MSEPTYRALTCCAPGCADTRTWVSKSEVPDTSPMKILEQQAPTADKTLTYDGLSEALHGGEVAVLRSDGSFTVVPLLPPKEQLDRMLGTPSTVPVDPPSRKDTITAVVLAFLRSGGTPEELYGIVGEAVKSANG